MSNGTRDWSRHTLQHGRVANVKRQIDPGTYIVKLDKPGASPQVQQVGWCYAESGTGGTIVEHYAMFDGYGSPTGSEKLILEPTGAGGASYTSLIDFLDDMKDKEPVGAPYSYIESSCTYYSSLP